MNKFYIMPGDFAYIFRKNEGKLEVVAVWYLGLLEKASLEHYRKRMEESKKDKYMNEEAFVERYELIKNMTLDQLDELEKENVPIVERFLKEELEFIPFDVDDTETYPEAEFPDGSIMIGSYGY